MAKWPSKMAAMAKEKAESGSMAKNDSKANQCNEMRKYQ
jgi:hypothetical protein